MPDSAPVQELQGLEKVLTEPVQLVGAEREVAADLLGEGVALDVLDPDDGSPLVRRPCLEGRIEKADDVGVVELAELLSLPHEAARGRLADGDFVDASRFALLDQVGARGRALPEDALDSPAVDRVASACGERVDVRLCLRLGQLVLDRVELAEELADRLRAVGGRELRGPAYEIIHGGADRVRHRGGDECVLGGQLARELTTTGCRRLAGQDEVARLPQYRRRRAAPGQPHLS